MRILKTAALLAFVSLPAAGQRQSTDNSFNWSGKVPVGRWIRVQNVNGAITVGAASGDNVEVVATKRWRRGDPSVVRIENSKTTSGGDVLICALWGDEASCDERGSRSRSRVHNNDVSVDFRVLVPKGVKVGIATVNGAVSVDGATAEVNASTVNGELEVATSGGRVNASNVNGSVRARLGRIDTEGDMSFDTVNGSVIVEFNGDFGGDVELETVNGSLNTNFEMTVSGRLDPKHLRAHIGKPGGPRIKLETVNGSVELRKN